MNQMVHVSEERGSFYRTASLSWGLRTVLWRCLPLYFEYAKSLRRPDLICARAGRKQDHATSRRSSIQKKWATTLVQLLVKTVLESTAGV